MANRSRNDARLVWVQVEDLCFGFESDAAGIVVVAPPVARWMLGKTVLECAVYWKRRGADVQWRMLPGGAWQR